MNEHNMCIVSSGPFPSNSRHFSSFKDSLALLHIWQVNLKKVKLLESLAHCLWWKLEIYMRTQLKWAKKLKQSLNIFMAIKRTYKSCFIAELISVVFCIFFVFRYIYIYIYIYISSALAIRWASVSRNSFLRCSVVLMNP